MDNLTALDIQDKSVSQLKEMGFVSVLDSAVSNSTRNRFGEPNLSAAEQHRMEMTLEGLAAMRAGASPDQQLPTGYFSNDEDDQEYLKDSIEDISRSPHEQRNIEKRIEEQKRIDDARIAVVYEALSRGVELKDNELYTDMLDQYPYFQKKLQQRKSAMHKLQRLAKMTGSNTKDDESSSESLQMPKYKFEERFFKKAQRKQAN